MLATELTRAWGLRMPIIGAPMSPQAGGELAAAVSLAGGLGMIGVGAKQAVDALAADVADFRARAGDTKFGIGLMAWSLAARPEILDAAIAARPFLISVSFGDPAPYAARIRDAGIVLVSQVQDRRSALVAEAAGVAAVVAQGTEAGGHTGAVGTLPLLQFVLDAVRVPVIAAGGIATGRGLAAVLAAGAQAGWIGTPLLVAAEARNSARAREQVIAADETQTVLTSVFDVAQRIPWPGEFRGRAIANDFSRTWHGREAALATDADATGALDAARRAEDYATAFVYAGQSVGAITRVEPAAAIIARIVDDAEAQLRAAAAVITPSA